MTNAAVTAVAPAAKAAAEMTVTAAAPTIAAPAAIPTAAAIAIPTAAATTEQFYSGLPGRACVPALLRASGEAHPARTGFLI